MRETAQQHIMRIGKMVDESRHKEEKQINEYSVKVSVRNNLILQRMRQLGIPSQTELGNLSGLGQRIVNHFVNMKRRPVDYWSGEWTDDAFTLSAALKVEPEDLWTEKQRGMALERNWREISMSEDAVMQLATGQGTEQIVQGVLDAEAIGKAIQTLDEREQKIITGRFFEDKSLDDLADALGVSRERIRQIEVRALKKLKHPSIAKTFSEYKKKKNEPRKFKFKPLFWYYKDGKQANDD